MHLLGSEEENMEAPMNKFDMLKPTSSRVCELCSPRDYRAMRALESLTPSGSEFVNDPEACVEFVRHKLQYMIQLAKERNQARGEVEVLKQRLDRIHENWKEPR